VCVFECVCVYVCVRVCMCSCVYVCVSFLGGYACVTFQLEDLRVLPYLCDLLSIILCTLFASEHAWQLKS